MSSKAFFLAAPAILTVGIAAWAGEPTPPPAGFEDAIAEARATATKADDARVAADVLRAAKRQHDTARLADLCGWAYRLGATGPEGHGAAAEAMELLAAKLPGRRRAALKKAADIRRRWAL